MPASSRLLAATPQSPAASSTASFAPNSRPLPFRAARSTGSIPEAVSWEKHWTARSSSQPSRNTSGYCCRVKMVSQPYS